MMTARSKGSLLVILGMFLIIANASLTASSESFAEEAGQTNIGVTFYGGKAPLETEDITKSTEQPITNKDKKTAQRQEEMPKKNTAKTNPTNAQMSLPRTGERNSRWLYSLGIVCLLIVIISFYYLNKKRKKEK
ncbi:LPXTG cell wall anchor domain-containing protein [Enterococcus faecalis]|uniref:LPXTG cell wall anchor domain-containing protein n=1 Tax=Enterococcus faecalis TaxID=1351 RepID=UPI0001B2E365|nr:LPXTG cell wall anchor domain-containing protein [Enterococcus faecalis]EEU78683.1 cell wall surface anchor family protein [Enterococcus faecalis Fly1]EGO2632453.1 LPXTG cell wall anchor domain-containing protein [Enterococcus faecalis]EGO2834383.1 LPXTG cell wall anchor domain-containing protein [Enterococcus faecalis]EGO7618562.1 LPXTG cell wall anchor domain-containing protein [Enterococcus faecalis]EGO7913615.1 LPXTG cell wall anchor domain-containing protein [Enterococcus faecalis]